MPACMLDVFKKTDSDFKALAASFKKIKLERISTSF